MRRSLLALLLCAPWGCVTGPASWATPACRASGSASACASCCAARQANHSLYRDGAGCECAVRGWVWEQ